MQQGYPAPQYIGCQHHILDRILKHVLDFYIKTPSSKPNLNYEFIDILSNRYDELQQQYSGKLAIKKTFNPGWRDDFKFLYELCEAFRWYKVSLVLITFTCRHSHADCCFGSTVSFQKLHGANYPLCIRHDGTVEEFMSSLLTSCYQNGGKNWKYHTPSLLMVGSSPGSQIRSLLMISIRYYWILRMKLR